MSYKFNIQTKAIPGYKVSVLNYKKKGNQQEDASIQYVDITQGLPICKNWQGAVKFKNNGCRDIRQPHL